MSQDYDLIVVGSGAGGLFTAVNAADAGLKVLLLEKDPQFFGGTSAYSGGVLWVPCNDDMARVGIKDELATAYAYVKRCVRGMGSDERVLAYVETANTMVQCLAKMGVGYASLARYPDYYQDIEGSIKGGRSMDPLPFDAAKLGLDGLRVLRDGNKTALVLGHICVSAAEAGKVVRREPGGMAMMLKIMARYYLNLPWRLRTKRDKRLCGGQALVAGLLTAARANKNITLQLGAPLTSLLVEEGRVVGVNYSQGGSA